MKVCVYVMDTGSTDNSISKLRERGTNVETKVFDPWRFDVARNGSLGMVPNNV